MTTPYLRTTDRTLPYIFPESNLTDLGTVQDGSYLLGGACFQSTFEIWGYFVSLEGMEEKVEIASQPTVSTYADKHSNLLREPGRYLGIWTDPETFEVYLDVSVWVPTFDDALVLGLDNHQIAVYDVAAKTAIKINGN